MTEQEINEIHKDLETEHKLWFLGEDKEDVIELANKKGLTWRIIEEDYKPML